MACPPSRRPGRTPVAVVLLMVLATPARAADDPTRVQLDAAAAAHRAGQLDAAVEGYRAVLAADPESDLAAEAANNLCVALADLARYLDAGEACARAEQLRRPLGGVPLADTLNNIALIREASGDPAAARAAYLEALELYRAADGAAEEVFVLGNLAALAIGQGELGEALERIDEAERLASAAGEVDWAGEELTVARIQRAVTLERLGAYREALAQLEAVAPVDDDPARAATAALNSAVLYRNLGDPWRALARLEQAAGHADTAGNRALRTTVAINRGLIQLHNLNQPEAARGEFDVALALASEAGNRGEQGRAHLGLGLALLALSDPDRARAEFEAALALAAETGAAETRWQALAGLARTSAAAGDHSTALTRATEALEIVETVGRSTGQARLAEQLATDQRALFSFAVDLAIAAGRTTEALALSERSRAIELLARLGGRAASPVTSARIEQLRDERADRATTVVYFAGERRLWRFQFGADRTEVVDVGPALELMADALAVHADLARRRQPDAIRLNRLGRSLLAGLDETRPLTIVPDGALFYLPFELLPMTTGGRLVERRPVTYAPSLSILAHLRPQAERPARRLAALADPDRAAGARTGTAALLAERFALAPLPGARQEAVSAGRHLGGRSSIDLGPDATEARLARRMREGARVLLVAAHTVLDDQLARGVAIFLSPGSGAPDDDGLVEPLELAALPISVEIAVLSGCRTAVGARPDGSSLASLSGALLAGGARSVIATLWEVGDRAAASLLDGFFWELGRGRRPTEALQAAKLRLASDPRWAGTTDWSAFVLIGDPEPVVPNRTPWTIAASVVALALAAIVAWRARRSVRAA